MAETMREQVQKNKRILWLVIIILLILIIAALIYLYLVFYNSPTEPVSDLNNNANQTIPAPEITPPGLDTYNQPNSAVLADIEAEVGANGESMDENIILVANSFAERFGSYSNQSDYLNFADLDMFMTDSMSNWIPRYIDQLDAENPDFNIYYAIETKVISNQINQMAEDSTEAEILIKTQRQEFENDIGNPRIFYQDLRLDLVKVNDEWKVNGAYWE